MMRDGAWCGLRAPGKRRRPGPRRALTEDEILFPRVVAAAATMASNISTEQYLWGLHRLLDGITTSQGIDPESPTARRNPRR
jgi:hypothetical protein